MVVLSICDVPLVIWGSFKNYCGKKLFSSEKDWTIKPNNWL